MPPEEANQRLPEKAGDTPPDSTYPYGPCSRCGRQSNFTIVGAAPLTYDTHLFAQNRDGSSESLVDERVSILQCQGCTQNMMVVEEKCIGGQRKRDGNVGSGAVQWVGAFWWPAPGATVDPAVPAEVADAVAEGTRCLLVRSPRAAAVMFRGALGQIVTDLGSAEAQKRRDLVGQLKQMASDGALNSSLAEWADTVRVLGNAGAHPNELQPVSEQDAGELARLIRSIIDYLYVVPARVKRAREGRR